MQPVAQQCASIEDKDVCLEQSTRKQLELLLRWHYFAFIAHRHMLLTSCQVKLLLLHEVYTGIIWA